MNFTVWLAGQAIVIGVIMLGSWVYSTLLRRSRAAKTLVDLQRSSTQLVGMYTGLLVVDFFALAAIGVALGGLSGWVMVGAALILAAWVVWNWPAKRRLIMVDAETDIAGDPYKVSAFFADVRAEARWQTGLISSVAEGIGVQGPRFHMVAVIPGSGQQIEGDAVLRVNDPGKEVVVGVEGAGQSADQYLLSPSGGGTHVLYRTVLELPFFLALAGGMFLAGDKDRPRRHTDELARAKAVFEAANSEPS
jgi:hypothetical protein